MRQWSATKHAQFVGGQFYLGGSDPTLVGPSSGWFNAIDVSTGVFNWRNHLDLPADGGALVMNYTASGQVEPKSSIVFTGLLDGRFGAYDGKSGKLLWQYDTGSVIWAPSRDIRRKWRTLRDRRVGRARLYEGAGAEGDHRSERADGIRFRQAKTGHEVAGGRKQWQRRILGDDHARSRP
jgi:outer membrane protein assembly factor BamB